jgi:hypothetical protein
MEGMTEPDYDPVIVDYVAIVANRFGASGLEDLIKLATARLDEARAALQELQGEGGETPEE